jgi:hypothetical protein
VTVYVTPLPSWPGANGPTVIVDPVCNEPPLTVHVYTSPGSVLVTLQDSTAVSGAVTHDPAELSTTVVGSTFADTVSLIALCAMQFG